ncbi:mRNA-decapping enzyme 1A isoform X2 [Triplophysa dalaica]|uniref:mRNA-decapping enzyme 1A isoform X2 n=1 Tax=Triplophysa dalaica TaxID=1582913 RepID=UPI0024DF9B80|nr:mRNA-decapping enzyme 1A isoform X2 [Triplophysa dalaica]
MECVNKAGQMMSLAALQQYDPYIMKLLDVTGQVALYTFNSKANEWEKTEIEGTLFVYARSASPHHGFTIMNRLSTENLVEPINKDLEFQLQDPFLLYRNGNLGIYSIWFYDKTDCQRIAQLMLQIVKKEALRAQQQQQQVSPDNRTNGCVQSRPTDILELLSKAKEEYQRSQWMERDDAQSQDKREDVTDRQEMCGHSVVKQITVEELFGSSLPKETLSNPTPSESTHALTFTPRLSADPGGTALVSLLQGASIRDPQHPITPKAPALNAEGSCGPVMRPLPPALVNPLTDRDEMPSSLVTPQSFIDLGCKLPPSFTGKSTAAAQSKELNTQTLVKATPMKAVPGVQGEECSLLLSPSMFQHGKTTDPPRIPPSPPSPTTSLTLADFPSVLCSRTQLQETLVHLIKNDARFLAAIHEALVQTLTKGVNNGKL